MSRLYNQKGITLIALVVTIIVLSILASISVIQGTSMIERAKAETAETNMLTIKAKAKQYAEDVEAKNWTKTGNTKQTANETEYTTKYLFEKITESTASWFEDTENNTYYKLTKQALEKMKLDELYEDNKTYVIKYPNDGSTQNIDIIYSSGVKFQKQTYYELSELQEVLQ